MRQAAIDRASTTMLAPSHVIRSSPVPTSTASDGAVALPNGGVNNDSHATSAREATTKSKRRRNNRTGKNDTASNKNSTLKEKAEKSKSAIAVQSGGEAEDRKPSVNRPIASSKGKKSRKRSAKKPTPTSIDNGSNDAPEMEGSQKTPSSSNAKPQEQGKKKPNRKRNARKKYPWRQHIPAESVDPITLDSLQSLTYPPFALVAEAPFDPVDVWPIPEVNEEVSKLSVVESEEERHRRVLEEQWGDKIKADDSVDEAHAKLVKPKSRHYHLYDGRALAYWMAASNQFIDPLNRRDITRDELVNLDYYLKKHGFHDLNVTEAYDTKGVTISTAGAAGNTAAGRATILQQEASVLLNSLFGRTSVSRSTQRDNNTAGASNPLMAQYQAYEGIQGEQPGTSQHHRNSNVTQEGSSSRVGNNGPGTYPYSETDAGVYGDLGGILIIDDDLNPGLRGAAAEFFPSTNPARNNGSSNANILWSASHIANRYSHASRVEQHEFPSLAPTAVPTASSTTKESLKKKRLPKVKTLNKIATAVKKTEPEELQRQWEAREEARRKATMSTLRFGSDPSWNTLEEMEVPTSITTTRDGSPSETHLERNRAFAEALGVTPVTQRESVYTGWARPVLHKMELGEFGDELNVTIFPDALIMEARERMQLLSKIEKKWKGFLIDDTAASLPLSRMDRPTRAFIHLYSDYWKLHTESFDPEPNRYIHCVKLRDTAAPYPLLSDAARNWRGPRPLLQNSVESDRASLQTAGQSTGRDLSRSGERVPLHLKPRSTDTESPLIAGGISIGGACTHTLNGDLVPTSRFAALACETERPKLDLQKRTLPLEMPPFQPEEKGFNVSELSQKQRERMEEKSQKEREKSEQQRRLLAQAFASDDEGDGVMDVDDDSWQEPEAEYQSSNEDES